MPMKRRRAVRVFSSILILLAYAEVSWDAAIATAVAIMTPAIILTMIFQRYVVQDLTLGASKG